MCLQGRFRIHAVVPTACENATEGDQMRLRVTLAALVLLLATATPAVAGDPVINGVAPDDPPRALTAAERDILASKQSLALTALRMLAVSGEDAVRPAPESGAPSEATPMVFCEGTGTCPPSGIPTTYILSVYARQQQNCWYCGPAAGQVADNRSWGIYNASTGGTTTANNKHIQTELAAAMGTTTDGTSGGGVRNGLNAKAKLPADFAYFYTSSDQNTGNNYTDTASLYGKLITDVYDFKMVMVLPVRPHLPGASVWLSSWPIAVSSGGHYIAVHGYKNAWSSSHPSQAIAYYADSASGCAGGNQGVTGKWTDPIYDLWRINNTSQQNVIW